MYTTEKVNYHTTSRTPKRKDQPRHTQQTGKKFDNNKVYDITWSHTNLSKKKNTIDRCPSKFTDSLFLKSKPSSIL